MGYKNTAYIFLDSIYIWVRHLIERGLKFTFENGSGVQNRESTPTDARNYLYGVHFNCSEVILIKIHDYHN